MVVYCPSAQLPVLIHRLYSITLPHGCVLFKCTVTSTNTQAVQCYNECISETRIAVKRQYRLLYTLTQERILTTNRLEKECVESGE